MPRKTGKNSTVPRTPSETAPAGRIRTYSPDLIREGAARIDGRVSPKLEAACGTDGLIRVKLDEPAILQRISHDLYSDPKSALRELYANEVRACRTARDEYGAKPRIDITVDSAHRKMTIEGVDSLGIDQDVFLQVMAVLGRSDNFDGRAAGQFGMGFASYTLLSDVVIVYTHSRVTGEKYGIMGKSGIGFQPLPAPRDMDWFGTRVTLTVRDDIELSDLVKYVCTGFWFSGIETRLHLPCAVYNRLDCELPSGTFRVGPFHPSVYMCGRVSGTAFPDCTELLGSDGSPADIGGRLDGFTGTRHLYPPHVSFGSVGPDDERAVAVEFHAEDDDVEVYGLISAGVQARRVLGLEYRQYDTQTPCRSVFLAGMPISADLGTNVPGGVSVTVNVKDERRYMPTPDRERFREEALSRLRARVRRLIKSGLPRIRLKSMYDCCRLRWALDVARPAKPTDDAERMCHRFLNSRFRTSVGGHVAHCGALPVMPYTRECADKMVHLSTLADWKINAVRSIIPDASVFSIPKCDDTDRAMLRQLGVASGEDLIAEYGIESMFREGAPVSLRIFSNNEGINAAALSESTCMSDSLPANEHVLAVPRNHWKDACSALLSLGVSGFNLIRKPRRRIDGIVYLDDVMSEIETLTYATNRGRMSADRIAKSRPSKVSIMTCRSFHPSDLPCDLDSVCVAASGPARFGLYLYFHRRGIDVTDGDADPVALITGGLLNRYHLHGRTESAIDEAACIRLASMIRGISSAELRDMLIRSLKDTESRSRTSAEIEGGIEFAVRADSALSGIGCA